MLRTSSRRRAGASGSPRSRRSVQARSANGCRLRSGTVLTRLRPVSRHNAATVRQPSGPRKIGQHATGRDKQLMPMSPDPNRNERRNLDRHGLSDPQGLPVNAAAVAADMNSPDLLREGGDLADRDTAITMCPRATNSQAPTIQRGTIIDDPLNWQADYVARHFANLCPNFPGLEKALIDRKVSGSVLLLHIGLDNIQIYLGMSKLDSKALDRMAFVREEIDRLRVASPKYHAHYDRMFESNRKKDYGLDQQIRLYEELDRRYMELKRAYQTLQRLHEGNTLDHQSLFTSSPFYDDNTDQREGPDWVRRIYSRLSSLPQEIKPVLTELSLRLNPLGPLAFQSYQFTAMVKNNLEMPLSESDIASVTPTVQAI
jgi:hypothetical protein